MMSHNKILSCYEHLVGDFRITLLENTKKIFENLFVSAFLSVYIAKAFLIVYIANFFQLYTLPIFFNCIHCQFFSIVYIAKCFYQVTEEMDASV